MRCVDATGEPYNYTGPGPCPVIATPLEVTPPEGYTVVYLADGGTVLVPPGEIYDPVRGVIGDPGAQGQGQVGPGLQIVGPNTWGNLPIVGKIATGIIAVGVGALTAGYGDTALIPVGDAAVIPEAAAPTIEAGAAAPTFPAAAAPSVAAPAATAGGTTLGSVAGTVQQVGSILGTARTAIAILNPPKPPARPGAPAPRPPASGPAPSSPVGAQAAAPRAPDIAGVLALAGAGALVFI